MTKKSLSPLVIAGLIISSSLGAAAHAAPVAAPAAAKPVDMAKFYQGVWIEIGRRPMKLTDGCVAGATEYRPRDGGRLEVIDTCHDQTPAGKLKSISGPGRIMDPGTNTKLHVRYNFLGFLPVSRDYWILDHDDAYTWFISSNPGFTDLWIYTRDTHPDPALLTALIEKAKGMGYDVSKLEFPAQP
jgi:apolipoprotein D and lipocalin family protein